MKLPKPFPENARVSAIICPLADVPINMFMRVNLLAGLFKIYGGYKHERPDSKCSHLPSAWHSKDVLNEASSEKEF